MQTQSIRSVLACALVLALALPLRSTAFADPAAKPVAQPAADKAKPAVGLKPVPPPTTTLKSADVARAFDELGAQCGRAATLREQVEALAALRKTSQGALLKAQVEAKKQVRAVTTAKGKIDRASKKKEPNAAELTTLVDGARVAYENAEAQAKTVENENNALKAHEDSLVKLTEEAAASATGCAAAETTLKNAALEAKKAVLNAKKEATKAKVAAKLGSPAALTAGRDRQAKGLEALKTSTGEAKTAYEAAKAAADGAGKPAVAANPVKPDPAKPATAAASNKPAAAGTGKPAHAADGHTHPATPKKP